MNNCLNLNRIDNRYVYNKEKRIEKLVRIRFVLFLAIMTILTVTMVNMIIGIYSSQGASEKSFTTVKISQGDTLWNIANSYDSTNDMSTSEKVYIICKFNNISAKDIKEGMIIKIPLEITE